MYLQNFIYVVVGQIETPSYTKCTKSAVIRYKTWNQRVAKLSVKYYTGGPSTDGPKGYMWIQRKCSKYSPELSQTASPLFDSCSDMFSPAHTWTSQCFKSSIFAMCLVHLLLHDTPDRIVYRIHERIYRRGRGDASPQISDKGGQQCKCPPTFEPKNHTRLCSFSTK